VPTFASELTTSVRSFITPNVLDGSDARVNAFDDKIPPLDIPKP